MATASGDSVLSLDQLNTWSMETLRDYLEERDMPITGTKDELIAMVYTAHRINKPKVPKKIRAQNLTTVTGEHVASNCRKYRQKLYLPNGRVLNDPYEDSEGWETEKTIRTRWPLLKYKDIMHHLAEVKGMNTGDFLEDFTFDGAFKYHIGDMWSDFLSKEIGNKGFVVRSTLLPHKDAPSRPPLHVWTCFSFYFYNFDSRFMRGHCTCMTK